MEIPAASTARPDWTPVYDSFVTGLRRTGVGTAAPGVGERFPDFALPDDQGRYRSLASFLARGPVVLSFNRGGWCPYCRRELTEWRAQIGALADLGAQFVSIAGETGGRAARLHDWVGPDATVLCDVDHGLALAVGLAFRCGDSLRDRYLAVGLDLGALYGNDGWILPVPATYVLDRAGVIRFAFVDPDFRVRATPDEVLAVVRRLS